MGPSLLFINLFVLFIIVSKITFVNHLAKFVENSVADPWHFGVDPDPDSDPDPAIFVIDLQDASKKLIF